MVPVVIIYIISIYEYGSTGRDHMMYCQVRLLKLMRIVRLLKWVKYNNLLRAVPASATAIATDDLGKTTTTKIRFWVQTVANPIVGMRTRMRTLSLMLCNGMNCFRTQNCISQIVSCGSGFFEYPPGMAPGMAPVVRKCGLLMTNDNTRR